MATGTAQAAVLTASALVTAASSAVLPALMEVDKLTSLKDLAQVDTVTLEALAAPVPVMETGLAQSAMPTALPAATSASSAVVSSPRTPLLPLTLTRTTTVVMVTGTALAAAS